MTHGPDPPEARDVVGAGHVRPGGHVRPLLLLLFAGLACAQQTTITVLATTDMHGNLYPIDYVTDQPVARGLAKMATLIRAEEAATPTICSSIAAIPSKARR